MVGSLVRSDFVCGDGTPAMCRTLRVIICVDSRRPGFSGSPHRLATHGDPRVSRQVGLRSLLPYLRVHRSTLVLVAVLSLGRAGGTLLQPLLTRTVLNGV